MSDGIDPNELKKTIDDLYEHIAELNKHVTAVNAHFTTIYARHAALKAYCQTFLLPQSMDPHFAALLDQNAEANIVNWLNTPIQDQFLEDFTKELDSLKPKLIG